jgi:pyruvate,orthophosphate dikinase
MSDKKYVYSFAPGSVEGNRDMRDALGGKGANLAEMAGIGIPVPPGFTVSTEVCNLFLQAGNQIPSEVGEEILDHLDRLGDAAGQRLGDEGNPLLVSVRSGAKFSMPGMMDTILNLGLNDLTVEGLSVMLFWKYPRGVLKISSKG